MKIPISNYFNGAGNKVMQKMKAEYGTAKGKSTFYATANKRRATPGGRGAGASNKQYGKPRSFGFGK